MPANAELGEIYVGGAVEEWSERSVIQEAYTSLTAAGEPFLVLANFQIGGRQFDCVFVTRDRVVVVEVKVSARPVSGAIDGDWARLHVSGEWRHYRNAYQQALGQKVRLRDAMSSLQAVGTFYPDAAVVFARPLADGSSLTAGDEKVAVTDLGRFSAGGRGDRLNPWTADQWRSFAQSLSLRRASLKEVLGGTELAPQYALVRDYRDRMASELSRDGDHWLHEDEEQRALLMAALQQSPGCYLEGPSGCGKTLAARWLGARLARSGECVLFLAAKDFDGSWSKLLRRELSLIAEVSTASLLSAIRATGTPVRIVLDGINELGASQEVAFRGLRALARRLDAGVIVTGQSALPAQLAGLSIVAIAPPSLELKHRIAQVQLPTLGAGIRAVLKALTSGFEAAIVAEVGIDVAHNASRQILVDQLIRKRLGKAQRSGAAGLRRFAQALIETTSFSMNETVFDEMLLAHGLCSSEIDDLFAAQLIVRRSGRVSFSHEILLNACAASAYAHIAPQAGEKFAVLLSLPLLQPIAADILAVIEEPEVVALVLRTCSDHTLIFDAARGLAGPIAAEAADRLLSETEANVEAEISGLRLAIVIGDKASIAWEFGSVRERSGPEQARINALAREIGTGRRVQRYFELCAAMDEKLYLERQRVFDDAAAAGIRALRSDAFSLAYYGMGNEPGFTQISRSAGLGILDIVDPPTRSVIRDMMSLTSGQLHFYLDRRGIFLDHANVDEIADGLARVVRERFRLEPYHVKLAILHAAVFVGSAEPAKVMNLVDAIQEIDTNREGIWISTSIVDALKYLGALEESAEGAREGIAAEFERAINAGDEELTRSLALHASTAMFDHPYDWIYYEEFEALKPEDRHMLMRRAARAENVRQSMSLAWVVGEIASFGDKADADIMQEFAKLPDPQNSFPQWEWAAFTMAICFLGRNGLALPEQTANTDVERTMFDLRALLHASAAGALVEDIWQRLDQRPVEIVMGCFTEVEHALLDHHWSHEVDIPRTSLLNACPSKWLDVARRFLDGGQESIHHHRAYGRDRTPGLAFQIVEMHGDRGDVARLRALAGTSRHARRALDALRKLDTA